MSSKVRRGSDYAKDANYSTRCSNNFWENSTPDRNGGNSCVLVLWCCSTLQLLTVPNSACATIVSLVSRLMAMSVHEVQAAPGVSFIAACFIVTVSPLAN